MLTVEGVSAGYASVQALFGASFDVPPRSVVALLGANGAAKSTLARVVSGLLPCTTGTVTSVAWQGPAAGVEPDVLDRYLGEAVEPVG